MADSAAFTAANTPGRGSDVGDFVPGKKGGWVPKNHPDAIGNDTPQRVQGDPLTAAADPLAGLPPGSAGANAGEAGPTGAAMAGLSAAASGNSGSALGVQELAPQGASNPMLGQRIYPMAMKQLAMLPRVY